MARLVVRGVVDGASGLRFHARDLANLRRDWRPGHNQREDERQEPPGHVSIIAQS
jgi:hypothetical protein